jgi:hypothetical protein
MSVVAADGMVTFVSAEETEERRIDISKLPTLSAPPVVRDYFGASTERLAGPQAFLIETYPADSETAAHFHSTDQFQIFFPAEGAYYQRTEIRSPLLHYSDAYTTYGPFGTGGAPMGLYTLRRRASEITGYMPKDRDKRVRRGWRNVHVDLGPALEPKTTPGTSRVSTLIEPQDDGLAAYLITAGSDTPVAELPTDHEQATAQYLCVLEGQLTVGDRVYGPRSLGWRTLDAPLPALASAGVGGFSLLVLQFPSEARLDN